VSHEKKLRVVVADDTQLVLQVCSCLVNGCRRAELVGTAQNGAELLEMCRSLRPDLALVDAHMPVRAIVSKLEVPCQLPPH
jgi:chemotaxis response regulator CheB